MKTVKASLSEDEGRPVAAALRVPAGGLHCGLGHHAGAGEDRRERRARLQGKQVTQVLFKAQGLRAIPWNP